MIITCESCTTQFQLDSSRIPAQGIRVRCTICKHAFFVENHEAATGDPVDRSVGRVLIEDEEGIPGVTHDLGSSGHGGEFAQNFAAARSAVDDLLGLSAPARVEGGEAAAPEPGPPAGPWEDAAEAADEIVFDVDAALAAEATDPALPGADLFDPPAPDPGVSAPGPAPWSTSALADDAPAFRDATEPRLGTDLDPWDTPLPEDGPALPEPAAEAASRPDADPWDTPLPFDDAPAVPPAAAAPAAEAEGANPFGTRWEGWEASEREHDALEAADDVLEVEGGDLGVKDGDLGAEPEELEVAEDLEADEADLATDELDLAAEEEDLANALAAEPAQVASAAPERGEVGSEPEDELEEALKLGWGGDTDTAGLELAEGSAPARGSVAPSLDAEPDATEGWEDLDLDGEPEAAGAHPLAVAPEAALPAFDVGTRLGAPRRRRVLAWVTALGDGTGWTIVAGLAAVLLWASLAPRAAPERADAALALAGLEASGIEGRWVENAVVGPVLVVSGELRNASSAARAPEAPLVVRLLDDAGAPLDGKATHAGLPLDRERLREASAAELRAARDASADALTRAELRPGESTRFEAVILSVPEAAGRFELASEPR